MNLKPLKLPLIMLCSLAFLLAITATAQAQSFLPACVSEGYCSLCDIMQLAINFGKFLLGIVGSLALLMFVYGGFMWLTSGGEASRIEAGKKILVNSVIGVGITFFAWVVVAFVVSTLTAGNASFKWDVTLNCAPLPGLEPIDVENRDPVGVGTKKEGDPCTKSEVCGTDLFCDASEKCKKKLGTDVACKGVSIEAKKIADSAGIAIAAFVFSFVSPGTPDAAKYIAIMEASDVACMSNDCNMISLSGFGKCSEPKAGEGNIPDGGVCEHTKDCYAGLFCSIDAAGATKGKCRKKWQVGDPCQDDLVLDGSADDMCNYKCDTRTGREVCVFGDGIGRAFDKCTKNEQCQAGFNSCACDGADKAENRRPEPYCLIGRCYPKIPTAAYVICDGWSVDGENDNSRCVSNECSDGPLTDLGICVAQ